MTGSPLEAHPLPGTSKFFSTEEDENIPPPYAAQQALPPYSFCPPNNALGQPRTRSVPFGSGVTFEWSPVIPQSPDDIIFVTVRINKLGPRQSFDGHLPQRFRPNPRGFLRRLVSRLSQARDGSDDVRAVRMPRREYLRHHRHDIHGNYAGTEPKQDWSDAMIKSCYGRYQNTPINGSYQNAAMRM